MRKRLTFTTIVLIPFVALILLTSDRGGLAYFSPSSLEYETQFERTIWSTGIPFYRSDRERAQNPLVTMLIEDGFVTPRPDDTGRLELVFHWNEAWRDGDGPLYGVLHRNREQIMEWSRSNRECANIYWSEGFRLLRSPDRIDVVTGHEVLRHCWLISDTDKMRNEIRRLTIEIATLMAT